MCEVGPVIERPRSRMEGWGGWLGGIICGNGAPSFGEWGSRRCGHRKVDVWLRVAAAKVVIAREVECRVCDRTAAGRTVRVEMVVRLQGGKGPLLEGIVAVGHARRNGWRRCGANRHAHVGHARL